MLAKVGSNLKVRIPFPADPEGGPVAECPWIEVVGIKTPFRILGRIVNELVWEDLHGYRFGDIIEVEEIWLAPGTSSLWQVVGAA
jgi:hypothetical protein